MNGSAPNCSATGSQICFVRNDHPNAWRESAEFRHSSQAIATAMAKMLSEKRSVIPLKTLSPKPADDRKNTPGRRGDKGWGEGGRSMVVVVIQNHRHSPRSLAGNPSCFSTA